MCKYIILIAIIFSLAPVYADFTTYSNSGSKYNNFQSKLKMNQPKTNIISYEGSRRKNRLHQHKYPQHHYNSHYLSSNDLSALEKYALNRTYRRETDLQRLERLENLAFGATQYGDLASRYASVEGAILSRPSYKSKNSFFDNLANYFSGETTGFTPNLIPYPTYNSLGGFTNNPYTTMPGSSFSNNNIEHYSNGIFGGGWGFSGGDFGTGSSVKILP